jgi:plastocyanin
MRKLLALPLAVLLLTATGAAAKGVSTTVTITHTGYKPTAVSITTGDAVIFKNTDTVAHTVDFKSTTGMHCSAAVPLAVAAGQSATCTFSSAGTFRFSDATQKGKNFHGTITVSPPLVSSLKATPKTVVYGTKSTIAGKLASGQSGQSLQVHAQMCGDTKSSVVATIATTAGGAFSYAAQPLKKTTYTLSNKSLSASIGVGVKPSLKLKKVGRHRYSVSVSAAQSFSGKVATFQRYRRSLHRWVKVKRVTLGIGAVASPPTIIERANFRSHIKARQRVRVSLGQKQVGACYAPGRSNTIRS